jgi:hypothetical protein
MMMAVRHRRVGSRRRPVAQEPALLYSTGHGRHWTNDYRHDHGNDHPDDDHHHRDHDYVPACRAGGEFMTSAF